VTRPGKRRRPTVSGRIRAAVHTGIVMAVLAAAGCGNQAAAGEAKASTTQPPVDLTTEVLTSSDLPPGWVNDRSPFVEQLASSCLGPATDTTDSLVNQFQFWRAPDGTLPDTAEVLAYYVADGYGSPSARTKYVSVAKKLGTCQRVSLSNASGVVSPLAMPTVGQQSTAYQVQLTGRSDDVDVDLVVAWKGDVVLTLISAGRAPASESGFQALSAKAAALLHG
jgi:hypothetical protein